MSETSFPRDRLEFVLVEGVHGRAVEFLNEALRKSSRVVESASR